MFNSFLFRTEEAQSERNQGLRASETTGVSEEGRSQEQKRERG